MSELTADAIARLKPGRAMDAAVAEHVMGWQPDPLDPAPAPRYSADDALAAQVLDHLAKFVPATSVLDERPLRDGHRVDVTDRESQTILIEAVGPSRAAAVARFALLFVLHHPEAGG
ncbi:MAG TPA: hypothetical protein DCZ72_06070 [Armatimonadetes bacterium]|nr:hypothetical protein [Armatimonadota bacterium]